MPEITHLSDLTPDPQNARRHNARNLGQIVDALHRVGAARSIVIDETGMVLAGNGVVEAAAEAGIERVRVVDADGEELIAVRRRGLSDEDKKLLALYDNRPAPGGAGPVRGRGNAGSGARAVRVPPVARRTGGLAHRGDGAAQDWRGLPPAMHGPAFAHGECVMSEIREANLADLTPDKLRLRHPYGPAE